jgi:hypothetical protein
MPLLTELSVKAYSPFVDYARFVEIATGSVFEVVSQATIGRNQGFLNPTDYGQLYVAAEKQSRMLSGSRKSLETPCPSTLNHPYRPPSGACLKQR